MDALPDLDWPWELTNPRRDGTIVAHRATAGQAHQASEAHSLQPGTGAWERFGR